MQRSTWLLVLLCFISFSTAHAQQWRVVKKVYEKIYTAGLQNNVHDSTIYQYDYNKQRGSSLLNDTIKCDWERKYNLLGSNAPQITYANFYTYNNDDQLVTRAHYANDGLNNNWGLISTDTATYSSGKVMRRIYYRIVNGFGMKPLSHDIYEYNANGQVRSYFTGKSAGSNFAIVTDTKHYYTYNSADQLLLDSMSYMYLSVVTFLPGAQNASVYDAQGKLIEKVRYSIDTPNNKLNQRNYYYYNAQGQLAGDSLQTFYPPNVILSQNIHSYTYDAAGRLATDTFKKYQGPYPQQLWQTEITTYTYTSFGRIDKIEKRVINASDNSIYYTETTKYDYEHYWPLEVPNESQGPPRNTGLSLSPIPASNMLQIYWHYADAENIQGHIIDMNGRTLLQWEEKAKPYYGAYWYSKKIDIANLASGNYYLVLRTRVGTYHKQFVVAK
ncbi:MAG: hypothetical protein R2800_08215 [Flavipsychrobacter sp.]